MKLVRFLQKLINETVVIELKNGTTVQGSIYQVDINMNTHLKTVSLKVKGRNAINLDHITIRGNTIRSFILPETISYETLLVEDAPKTAKPTTTGVSKQGKKQKGRKK